ncbi:MAG: AEC family transporter [Hyphomicrobiaceae bacterium]|nr:AEC family transporter [Hyphomicrobiaceae bacterium]MCC0011140.1 AEC family transporter [Hyphomicrobiaceae bacterium]
MFTIVTAIAPVFVLVVLGHLMRRILVGHDEFWGGVDRIAYWVLLPALLFAKISTMEISAGFVGAYATVITGGFIAAFTFALVVSLLLGFPGPVASSVVQGASRHNTFIALAVTERVFGPEGQSSAYLASSILIPSTNIAVVIAMVMLHQSKTTSPSLGRAVVRDIVRNPLLVAVVAGLLFNAAGLGGVPVLHDVTDLLGRAALPMVLLSIGASIRFKGLRASILPMVVSTTGKMIVFPLAIFILAGIFSLGGVPASVAMIYGSCATATSSYALARQMGGDAPLAATIVTLQTMLSFVTIPLAIQIAASAFG